MSPSKMLDDLHFDNSTLRALPLDESGDCTPRQVRGACFSRVRPTPVENPVLVAVSGPALRLLDLPEHEAERPEFVQVFAGNTLLDGMEPASHCYCGYQFGMFSGQLGDGAAIYLGEVVNEAGERWEVQLKGAGLTPYSRSADGRKVLRSSIREFLASEAMYHLGVATTRAAAVITSDSRVTRDPMYRGEPVQERCSLVTRMAPTFLRFGSFEIFLKRDPLTGRQGPSWDEEGALAREMIPQMLDHTIATYFPGIWQQHMGDSLQDPSLKQDMYMDFVREVVNRTAALVAGWQSVGFVHGVLNTDNMSILGLTLDYGPYGFMDRYDPGHVPNSSDDMGRYDYVSQPDICRWNCERLCEALRTWLPHGATREALTLYDRKYDMCYWRVMMQKLGLLAVQDQQKDRQLLTDFLQVMHETGADFTNTFRRLAKVPLPSPSADGQVEGMPLEDGGVLEEILSSGLADSKTLAKASEPRIPYPNLQLLALLKERDPALLAALGQTKESVVREMQRAARSAELRQVSPEAKAAADRSRWEGWLRRYLQRLRMEAEAGADALRRVEVMNSVNPRYVLRNWIAQQAIVQAEKGDYSEVRRVLRLLERPFDDDAADGLADISADAAQADGAACRPMPVYDGPIPAWAAGLCVSCSS